MTPTKKDKEDVPEEEPAPAPAPDADPDLVDPELGGSAPFLQVAYEDADPITKMVMDAAKANTRVPPGEEQPNTTEPAEVDSDNTEPIVPEGTGAPVDGAVGVAPEDDGNGEFGSDAGDQASAPQTFNASADDTSGR